MPLLICKIGISPLRFVTFIPRAEGNLGAKNLTDIEILQKSSSQNSRV